MAEGTLPLFLSWKFQKCHYLPFSGGIARISFCCIISDYSYTLMQAPLYFICLVYNPFFCISANDITLLSLTLMSDFLYP